MRIRKTLDSLKIHDKGFTHVQSEFVKSPKRHFIFEGFNFSLMKYNQLCAVYVASADSKILFYQIFHIKNNELVLNRFGRYKQFDCVRQEYEKLTKKNQNKHS